ncbi:MAG: protein kinase [Deltaproteobacteria bacterium]|nr:protein kinase [Deltaproteobacteria bacterium]
MTTPARVGRFTILDKVGAGGSGLVFLARADASDEPVIVKLLNMEHSAREGSLKRFRHEAFMAKSIASPNVAQVVDAGVDGDWPYIAMEYVAGWTLARILKHLSSSALATPLPEILAISKDMLAGLEALHAATGPEGESLGFVHRDIKPSNVILGEDHRTRLIDLGLGTSVSKDWATRPGAVLGTIGYMAPEQAKAEAVDRRADVYGAAVILWELLTRHPYAPRGENLRVLAFTMNPTFRDPRQYRDDFPNALTPVLESALASDPKARFASAKAFSDAIETAIGPVDRPAWEFIDDMLWQELEGRRTEVQRALFGPAGVVTRDTVAGAPVAPLASLAPEPMVTAPSRAPSRAASRAPRSTTKLWPYVVGLATIGVAAIVTVGLLSRGVSPAETLEPEPTPRVTAAHADRPVEIVQPAPLQAQRPQGSQSPREPDRPETDRPETGRPETDRPETNRPETTIVSDPKGEAKAPARSKPVRGDAKPDVKPKPELAQASGTQPKAARVNVEEVRERVVALTRRALMIRKRISANDARYGEAVRVFDQLMRLSASERLGEETAAVEGLAQKIEGLEAGL